MKKNYLTAVALSVLFLFPMSAMAIPSLGVATNRDEWAYDIKESSLRKKISFFCRFYEKEKNRWEKSKKNIPVNDFISRNIKFTSELENHLVKGTVLKFDSSKIHVSAYRPFVKRNLYFDKVITHRLYQIPKIFKAENKVIAIRCVSAENLVTLATDVIFDLAF